MMQTERVKHLFVLSPIPYTGENLDGARHLERADAGNKMRGDPT